jgi:hypothetical protein
MKLNTTTALATIFMFAAPAYAQDGAVSPMRTSLHKMQFGL